MFKPIRWSLLAGALLAMGAAAADNQLTAPEKAAGWLPLFDGRSFAGWEDPAAKTPPGDSFVIEDGCLKAVPNARITEDLFTSRTFRDFELEFDWKISPGGNTGVKYRIQDRVILRQSAGKFEDTVNASLRDRSATRPDRGQEYVVGFEYQLLDNALNPDARRGLTHRAGALYDMAAPSRDATRPVGQWNHSRLVVRGDRVEHWMNAVKVVDSGLNAPAVARNTGARWGVGSPVYELLVSRPRTQCPISLQNHESAAWFKNVKVRPL